MSNESILFEYGIVRDSISECVNEIYSSITQTDEQRWLACLNPHSYVIALNDSGFNQSLQGADWLVPDGIGIVLASRYLACPVQERITGSDIFHGLLTRLNQQGDASVFFLGATDEVLVEICRRMALDYPNVRVAGTFSPPYRNEFSETELDEMIDAVNAVKPYILWVGMTAPKQEKLIFRNRERFNTRFIGAIGAVFDFYSGKVKRPHIFFRKHGLEWLPLLLKIPRRTWRRMVVSAPIFIWHLLLAKYGFNNKKVESIKLRGSHADFNKQR